MLAFQKWKKKKKEYSQVGKKVTASSLNVRNLSVLVLPVAGHAQIYSSVSLRERCHVENMAAQ